MKNYFALEHQSLMGRIISFVLRTNGIHFCFSENNASILLLAYKPFPISLL